MAADITVKDNSDARTSSSRGSNTYSIGSDTDDIVVQCRFDESVSPRSIQSVEEMLSHGRRNINIALLSNSSDDRERARRIFKNLIDFPNASVENVASRLEAFDSIGIINQVSEVKTTKKFSSKDMNPQLDSIIETCASLLQSYTIIHPVISIIIRQFKERIKNKLDKEESNKFELIAENGDQFVLFILKLTTETLHEKLLFFERQKRTCSVDYGFFQFKIFVRYFLNEKVMDEVIANLPKVIETQKKLSNEKSEVQKEGTKFIWSLQERLNLLLEQEK